LREVLRVPSSYRYALFDRDAKFSGDVRRLLKASGITVVRATIRSPWQNGIAERWVGSIRREMLDHVIALNERHSLRLGGEYIRYYHRDRTYIGLNKATLAARRIESRPIAPSNVVAVARIAGLHHRYTWSAAA
jgi:transposase InsO family protein